MLMARAKTGRDGSGRRGSEPPLRFSNGENSRANRAKGASTTYTVAEPKTGSIAGMAMKNNADNVNCNMENIANPRAEFSLRPNQLVTVPN
jgi:hypothetical protein